MSNSTYLIIVGVISLALVSIVPQMLTLRIRVLRFLRWESMADWHERHRAGMTAGVRITLAIIGIVLIVIGVSGA